MIRTLIGVAASTVLVGLRLRLRVPLGLLLLAVLLLLLLLLLLQMFRSDVAVHPAKKQQPGIPCVPAQPQGERPLIKTQDEPDLNACTSGDCAHPD
jgi:hypothetical protein